MNLTLSVIGLFVKAKIGLWLLFFFLIYIHPECKMILNNGNPLRGAVVLARCVSISSPVTCSWPYAVHSHKRDSDHPLEYPVSLLGAGNNEEKKLLQGWSWGLGLLQVLCFKSHFYGLIHCHLYFLGAEIEVFCTKGTVSSTIDVTSAVFPILEERGRRSQLSVLGVFHTQHFHPGVPVTRPAQPVQVPISCQSHFPQKCQHEFGATWV